MGGQIKTGNPKFVESGRPREPGKPHIRLPKATRSQEQNRNLMSSEIGCATKICTQEHPIRTLTVKPVESQQTNSLENSGKRQKLKGPGPTCARPVREALRYYTSRSSTNEHSNAFTALLCKSVRHNRLNLEPKQPRSNRLSSWCSSTWVWRIPLRTACTWFRRALPLTLPIKNSLLR